MTFHVLTTWTTFVMCSARIHNHHYFMIIMPMLCDNTALSVGKLCLAHINWPLQICSEDWREIFVKQSETNADKLTSVIFVASVLLHYAGLWMFNIIHAQLDMNCSKIIMRCTSAQLLCYWQSNLCIFMQSRRHSTLLSGLSSLFASKVSIQETLPQF